MNDEGPKLRKDLVFFPAQSSGGTVIAVQDRLGLVEEGKGVNPELFKLMAMLDGTHSLRDIQMDLMRHQGGRLVPIEEIEAFMGQLDASYLLDSPRYREARNAIIADFSAQCERYPSHAGVSYPKEGAQLRERLESILSAAEAPLFPPGKITALVAPHIDLEAGKRVYSAAYQTVRGLAPKRVIILGVGHSMATEMFSVSTKAFATPLGRVKTDQELTAELTKKGDETVSKEDFAHRDEHSIEFQLIFLQHVLKGASFAIVPILCGSLLGCLPTYSREAYQSRAQECLRILAEAARDPGTLLVAGVDFSHVGPKFGHDRPAAFIIDESERHDRQLLQSLCAMSAEEFWSESTKVGDRYNVCGFSVLACLLEILPQCHGTLLDYEIFREAPTQSAVSFAAAVFTR
jgi:AmmeMemoRadiSam system protein B